MRKISVVSMFVLLTIPSLAEETVSNTNEVTNTANINEIATMPVVQKSNPKIKFPHGLQFGMGVSPTSGLNAFVGYNNKNFDSFWAKRFGVRIDFGTYSPIKNKLNKEINESIGDEGIEIDDNLHIDNVALNAKHYGALVDFYPFGNTWFLGGWRLSGGYMVGKLDLDANIHGKTAGNRIEFELGDDKFFYNGTEMIATAKVDWKYKGPYAGTGFDLGIFRGFKLYFDAGVVFTGEAAKIDLDVPLTNLEHANGTAVTQSELDTAKTKALADARKELDKYPYYPLVKIGFMYRF